jgi:hypothetical protein
MKQPITLAYGAGNNSKAMTARLVELGMPIDLILMADPGGELPHIYEDVRQTSLWLQLKGYPGIKIVKYTTKRATDRSPEKGRVLTLEQDCLERKALPSIAYNWRTCSDRWKIAPQKEFILQEWEMGKKAVAEGVKIISYIGFHADEPQRAKQSKDERFENHFPLIEWDWNTDDCVQYLKDSYLTIPGKSSCFFCPQKKKYEIEEMKTRYPDFYARAIAMEKNANLTTLKGLGRKFSWEWAESDETELDRACGCSDGY